jgi:hypothetical protein
MEKKEKRWWDFGKSSGSKDTQDKRIFARFRAEFPLKMSDLVRGTERRGRVVDIGARGVGLVSPQPLEPETVFDMWLSIPDGHEPFYTRGEVVWTRPEGTDSYRSGVRFDKVNFMGSGRALRANLQAV